jgi:cytochrome c biogenesis protein CcmG, thiol:disulfide interchange protein DsbE
LALENGMKRLWIWAPLGIFGLLFAVFGTGLIKPADRRVPSAMVGKPLPTMTLDTLTTGQSLSDQDFKRGKPALLNVFASWCVPCVSEIPVLVQMKEQGVDIRGVAVHDNVADLTRFLSSNGDPYSRVALDANGRAQIALGSAGVPETFVIDGKGVIRHQHIGVVEPNDVPVLLAQLKAAQ